MKKRKYITLLVIMLILFACSSTVYAESFGISKTNANINIGETLDLDVMGTGKTPSWTSWNVNKARVDQDGVVTALRTGKTTVSARIGITRKTCAITVVNPTVKLDKKSATIYTGGTSTKYAKLKATVKGSSKAVTWTSSDPEVAIVDSTGRVTSVAPGKAVISATANNKTANCNVTVKESAITLNDTEMQLSTKGTGSAITLKPTVVGSKKTVTWTSSDKKVATVDKNGKVTGKKSGTAVITAKANGVSATCNVTVEKGSISFGKESILLYAGETETLKTNASKSVVVTYVSSNPAVATVSEKGKVTAVAEGTATIGVYVGESAGSESVPEDTCDVTVKNTKTSVKENGIVLETKGTTTYKLKATVTGRKSTVAWKSADKKIATVDKNGKVTAKKAGTTTVTATANGVSDTVQVIVENYDPTIKLNYKDYVLYTKKGNTLTLKPTVVGKSKTVKWSSSNPAVAKVSSKGKVTALAEGQSVIRATANGVSAECLIDVKKSEVVLETKHIWMEKGQTAYLPADFIGANQTYKYSSSNTKIVTVSKTGKLTAKKYGSAKIKVTANGVSATCLVYVDKCVHEFDEGIVTTAPTCKDKGVRTITCGKCGYAYEAEEAKVDHNWEVAEHVDATCITSGEDVYKCTMCETERRDVLSRVDHNWGGWEVLVEASTESEGLRRQYCTTEGCIAKNEEAIPVIEENPEHSYAEEVVEPTCEDGGFTVYTCSCGDTYEDNFVEALGHDWLDWEVTVEPTETEKGEETRVCDRCDAYETRVVPELSHEHNYEYNVKVVEPTCEDEGYTVHTCDCGDYVEDMRVDALGHDFSDWETVREATEEAEGLEKRTCKREGCENEETQVILKKEHEHKYNVTVVEPTCTRQGYTLNICRCGDSYVDNYVEATSHEYNIFVITYEPTCICEGWTIYKCKCGVTERRDFKQPIEHNFVETKTKLPTCTENGYKTYTCDCGSSRVSLYGDALGHAWCDWKTIKAPTVTEEGEEKRVCDRCGQEETRAIPKHEHSYEENTTEPTCTEQGYSIYICDCGESYIGNYADELGHKFSEWIISKTPTVTGEGEEKRTCSRCSEEEIRSVPKHVHSYEAIIAEATCTEQGYTTYICGCGDSYMDTYVPSLGHDEGTWMTTLEPQLGVDGKKELLCNRCSESLGEEKIDMLLTDGVDSVYIVEAPKRIYDVDWSIPPEEWTYTETEWIDGTATVIGHYGSDAEVNKMFELVNEFRVENGKQPFTMNYEWLINGRGGAKERAVTTANYWEHWNYSYSENIAYTDVLYDQLGYTDMELVDKVFESWIESEGHKNNILHAGQQYYETGISVFYKRIEVAKGYYLYERYWVQVFE